MRYTRWVLAGLDGKTREPVGVPPRVNFAKRAILPGEMLLCECECDEAGFDALQRAAGVTVLPSLSAPAEKLAADVLAVLGGSGVALEAGDDVQQALRKLRAVLGKTVEDFKVDKAF